MPKKKTRKVSKFTRLLPFRLREAGNETRTNCIPNKVGAGRGGLSESRTVLLNMGQLDSLLHACSKLYMTVVLVFLLSILISHIWIQALYRTTLFNSTDRSFVQHQFAEIHYM